MLKRLLREPFNICYNMIMNLIFIYGPPASGKLTVATELANLTSYKLFHNHLTRDMVQDLYPNSLSDHYDLVGMLRSTVFDYCSRHDTNLIFTFVYDGPEDNDIVTNLVQSVTRNSGKVLFVELTAPNATLLERVENDTRKEHGKLVDSTVLNSLLLSVQYSSVSYDKIFRIDTSKNTPIESAALISNYYKLE